MVTMSNSVEIKEFWDLNLILPFVLKNLDHLACGTYLILVAWPWETGETDNSEGKTNLLVCDYYLRET